MTINKKLVLARYPDDRPTPACFRIEEEKLAPPADQQVLVAVERLSIDAWIATMLGNGSLHGKVPLGGLVPALGVGRVVASGSDRFRQGDAVFGPLCAQTHILAPDAMLQKLDVGSVEPTAYLGALGLTTGLTAHVGLVAVGGIKSGDTVVVSAAAGAVGSYAVEIARLRGAHVIGIAGGEAKVRYVTDTLGAKAAIDYKHDDVGARLSALAPKGVDLYFDNVGGELLDIVLDRLAPRARVVICGAISQYTHLDDVRGPKLYLRIAERNASMRGFTVDAWPEAHPGALAELRQWLIAGQFHVREQVERGIERFPVALGYLFDGGHMGKLTVAP